MIVAWIVWFFLAPHLFWLDRVVSGTIVAPLDIGLGLAFVFALFARASALPGLLLGAAVGRALAFDGAIALHFLAIGLPVAGLFPLRGVFFRGSVFWQGAAAVFLALAVPRVAQFFARITVGATDAIDFPSAFGLFCSAILVPPLAWCLRQLPPLRSFVEGAS